MSGIPYNRLQTVEFTAKTDNGETVVMETSHYAFVVPCRDCKHYTEDDMEYYHYCGNWCEQVEPDGFCAWGVRGDGDAR